MVAFTVLGMSGVAQAGGGGSDRELIGVQDDCDPATFNAEIGEGTCVGDGDTTFFEFARQLGKLNQAPKWRFHPDDTHIDHGDGLLARNQGGEFHTFTEVAVFGAGCIPEVNALMRNPGDVVAECNDLVEVAPGVLVPRGFVETGLPPAGKLPVDGLNQGKHLFQCLIHPWMRTVVEVRGDDHSGHH